MKRVSNVWSARTLLVFRPSATMKVVRLLTAAIYERLHQRAYTLCVNEKWNLDVDVR